MVEPERRARGSVPQWPATALSVPHGEHHLRTAEAPLRDTFRERVVISTACTAHSMHSKKRLIDHEILALLHRRVCAGMMALT